MGFVKYTTLGIALIFCFVYMLTAKPVFAQVKGISVSPSILQLDLRTSPAQALLTYTNNTTDTIDLALSAHDFENLGEEGQIQYLDPSQDTSYQFGLSSWLHFDTNALILSPGESKTVGISIEKQELPQGGHYASIFASVVQTNTKKPVALQPILASLIFVTADSRYNREDATIATFAPESVVPYFPQQFVLRIINNGNVQITPYGLIQIKDMFGRVIAKGILNQASLLALPDSLRRYDITITPTVPFLFPGFYTATLLGQYGQSQNTLTAQTSFFSQGSIDFVKIIAALIIIYLCWLVYKKWND